MDPRYALGLDYGTNTVRALIVRCDDGAEIGTHVHAYEHGKDGVVIDPKDPNLARQHPGDYLTGLTDSVRGALADAQTNERSFRPAHVAGIGVDTTGSTPIPVGETGVPIAMDERFHNEPDAMAWLWKDHTSYAEAEEITARGRAMRPEYLAKCGGSYSSEWFFSKIWRCLRSNPAVFEAAHSWVEASDWIPAVLTGTEAVPKRGTCAAGHKAMFNAAWGGLPDTEFLASLDPRLAALRDRLYDKAYTVDESAGGLTARWAAELGLNEGIPVAVGAFDAHLGAVGAGIEPGILVKIIGTSTCDMMVHPNTEPLADIPGLAGIVDGSVLPGYYGLEAGQSAVGDIFNWFSSEFALSHRELTRGAEGLKAGQSGLLALDWNNGNRCVLGDQRLSGLLVGQTLYTNPHEIYRALIEATAFGALMIIERLEEYGVPVRQIINCGGIAEKNPLVMQIYADVTGREMLLSRSAQTCALGSAIAGSVVAGVYPDIPSAQKKMTGRKEKGYVPSPAEHEVYKQMIALYRDLHNGFGCDEWTGNLAHVMKQLISIREETR